MGFARAFSLPFRYRLWSPSRFRLIMRDFPRPHPQREREHEIHLEALIDWLCRAQDQQDGLGDEGGVSAGWNFGPGWQKAYPETSGYIIETFLSAQNILERRDLRQRAQRILDWELSIQHSSGAFPGHHGEPGSYPVIFNTGQIMHGMLAGYGHLYRNECLEAAIRAGEWMVFIAGRRRVLAPVRCIMELFTFTMCALPGVSCDAGLWLVRKDFRLRL